MSAAMWIADHIVLFGIIMWTIYWLLGFWLCVRQAHKEVKCQR